MPVKTGSPSSASSAARVSSVIAFSGSSVLDAEAAVALDEVVEELGPDRPAAADVRVVRGHVLEPLGRAVRHQDDRGARSHPHLRRPLVRRAPRAAVRTAGIRRGSDAVAEVEDVTRPPSRAREDLERRIFDPLPRAEQERPGRGCPGRRARARPRPSRASSGDPPVEADHVAARGAPSARAGAPCRCRSGSSARRPPRGSAPSTARRTPRSRPARARRPTSRRAGSTSAPAAACAAT